MKAAERSDHVVLRPFSSEKHRIMGSFRLEKICETIETNLTSISLNKVFNFYYLRH